MFRNSVLFLLAATLLVSCGPLMALTEKRVFAFFYLPATIDPIRLESATLVHAEAGAWRYWLGRGVTPARGVSWRQLLYGPVDRAVDILTSIDHAGNPSPVVVIDEFGFDFGGQMDRKAAQILRRTKDKMANLSLAVWQMRGPIAPVLADAYRDVVDLVLPEAYVGGEDDYWRIITQVKAAQLQGLMHKTVVGLGLGVGGYPGENWAQTREELERQVRFVRFIAPESPGIAFFAAGVERGEPGLINHAEELCEEFDRIPTDGTGLPESLHALHRTFNEPRPHPVLVVSSRWVEPNRQGNDPDRLVQPVTMQLLLMNLGSQAAEDVLIQLRNPIEKGGEVFALGTVTVPGNGVAIAVLPVIAKWKGWKTWEIDMDVENGEVIRVPQG